MDHNASPQISVTTQAEKLVYFPRSDGSRIPYKVYSSPEIYRVEQERIFHGPVWSFLALEAEIPHPCDFKSTFVGDTPVVVTRNGDASLSAWVNRCAHRGAMVCRAARGNAKTHICAYHQWSYDTRGKLRGIPFRKGVKGSAGMPADFELIFHFFGYADDTPEMRLHRIKLANLVGPAGLVSMEDMLATELVQFGTAGSEDALSIADMCRDAPDDPQIASSISETYIRHFWRGYQELMGL